MSTALASVLVVFLAPAPAHSIAAESNAFERELAQAPGLSVGILSATQGAYTQTQAILDMTQGARVSPSAYDSPNPPPLQLPGAAPRAEVDIRPGAHQRRSSDKPRAAFVSEWGAVLRRADSAPQLLQPGLLASQIPGGGAYVPGPGVDSTDGALAADRSGRVSAVWLGGGAVASIARLQKNHRLVVADLAAGREGYEDMRKLLAGRPAGELAIVVQRPSHQQDNVPLGKGDELLWIGIAGLDGAQRAGAPKTVTSQTTNERGLVAAIDIAPTILAHLQLPMPADVRGKPIHTDGAFHGGYLRGLKLRLGVISGRRTAALGWLAIAWAALLLGSRLLGRGRGWALRVGGLALLWAPVASLVTASVEPSRTAEFALLVAICFALAALTDRLIPWPRAPLVPALGAVAAITLDALAGTQLLMRSLLGPNPAFGARFYGIGNELKSGLAVLVLSAAAAALYPAIRGRRAALAVAAAGIVLAAVEGSARIGAGVGGVILVSAGTAVAVAMLLPGALSRRRALLVMIAPVLGLVALAALDLATAHGGGHFSGSVLHARSASDVKDILVRRYGAAWDELRNHLMPLATAIALAAGIFGVLRRERVSRPVNGDPAWTAALTGGFAAGVVGALSEDSGPVLLVVAVGALACVVAYLWGKPQPAREPALGGAVAAAPAQHDLVL